MTSGRGRRAWLAVCVALPVALAAPARADDLADEADLEFELGAERYQASDFRAALQHFLSSNRLVSNRNVQFNVARSYEQLGRFPEAYRYYSQALDGEADADTRARVGAALVRIKPNVAVLHVTSDPPGATLYLERRDLGSRGTTPRTLGLAPGRYKLIAELDGHEPAEAVLEDAKLGTETTVTLRLERKTQAETGNLVVSADEPGALIEIDERPRGFTPAIVTVPAGPHKLRLVLKGFRPVEQSVVAKPNLDTRVDVALTQREEVVAASRAAESVEDAPSSVSIVPSQELRGMGYPSLVEALRGVRGVYTWDDRTYASLGMRGVGRLGGYGNRVLVLLDGQPTNDDWIGSSYVGYDFRTDLEDVERVEVVRGPGSVLYGTNAFSGVINVVTRGEGAKTGGEVGLSTAEYGVARGRARVNVRLGEDAGAWVSVGGAHAAGRDFYFPEYVDATSDGNARGVDDFVAGTFTGHAYWKALSATWQYQSRSKRVPTGQFETLLGDPRAVQSDTRGMLELKFEPKVGETLELMTRAHADSYSFRGAFPRAPADGGVETDTYEGRWVGLEQRVVVKPTRRVRLTFGGETQQHLRVDQRAGDDAGLFLDDQAHKFSVQAGYALVDVSLSDRVHVSAGTRLDVYSTFGYSNNPRLAVVFKPYERGNTKLMFGKAFRAPSVYELYYNDGGTTQIASPNLAPETLLSAEIEHTHRFSPTVSATAASYGTYVENLIVQRGGGTDVDPTQYQNSGSPVVTFGGELEVRRDFRQGWMLSASYSAQHSLYLASTSLSDLSHLRGEPTLRNVANAPEHLASVKGAIPLLGRGLLASTRLSIEGPRWDRYEKVDEPEQQRTEPALIWDLVMSGEEAKWGVRYAFGIYNVFDWRWSAPLSGEFRQRTIVQNGRTVMASVNAAF